MSPGSTFENGVTNLTDSLFVMFLTDRISMKILVELQTRHTRAERANLYYKGKREFTHYAFRF